MPEHAKPRIFFRVQTTGGSREEDIFVTRHSPSGGRVVTLSRDAYASAKQAAASALASGKKPA